MQGKYQFSKKELAEIEARMRGAKLADEGFAEVMEEMRAAERSLVEGMSPEEYQELIWRGAKKPEA